MPSDIPQTLLHLFRSSYRLGSESYQNIPSIVGSVYFLFWKNTRTPLMLCVLHFDVLIKAVHFVLRKLFLHLLHFIFPMPSILCSNVALLMLRRTAVLHPPNYLPNNKRLHKCIYHKLRHLWVVYDLLVSLKSVTVFVPHLWRLFSGLEHHRFSPSRQTNQSLAIPVSRQFDYR